LQKKTLTGSSKLHPGVRRQCGRRAIPVRHASIAQACMPARDASLRVGADRDLTGMRFLHRSPSRRRNVLFVEWRKKRGHSRGLEFRNADCGGTTHRNRSSGRVRERGRRGLHDAQPRYARDGGTARGEQHVVLARGAVVQPPRRKEDAHPGFSLDAEQMPRTARASSQAWNHPFSPWSLCRHSPPGALTGN
jgi:hypothetical protein